MKQILDEDIFKLNYHENSRKNLSTKMSKINTFIWRGKFFRTFQGFSCKKGSYPLSVHLFTDLIFF